MISLKSRREIRLMQQAGALVAQAHSLARELIRPGVTTREIDAVVDQFFARERAEPLFKGFPGKVPFPASTCLSVNQQVVHGIPGDYVLREGDILSLDTGCRINGWCGDAAWTYAVGEISAEKRHVMNVGRETLRLAIETMKTARTWSTVARAMVDYVSRNGCSLVEQFVGHGIGREMHEPPQVPNYFSEALLREDFELRPGLVLAIEPMVNAGSAEIRILNDHWTAITADGRPSVHFEHTVAMTAEGPLLLTEGVGEKLF